MNKKLKDHQGKPLKKGDTVKLLNIPLELFLGLTETEQKILRAEIGNMHLIQGPSGHRKIKLEFHDTNYVLRTILIDPSCVIRILR